FYFEPTVFTEVDNRMQIAQEEIFGPVASILKFHDEDDAVRIGNDVIYGLAAGVQTKDLKRAHRLAKRLQAGTVWINTWHMIEANSPFGGYKLSGYGRENGIAVYAHPDHARYLASDHFVIDAIDDVRSDTFSLEIPHGGRFVLRELGAAA